MLKAINISKSFGKKKVLDQVSFDLPSCGFYLLSGPNGGGKTTLLNILGLVDSDFEGSFEYEGVKISKDTKEETKDSLRKDTIEYIFQKDTFVSFLNAGLNANLSNLFKRQSYSPLSFLPEEGFEKKKGAELSDGEKTLIALERGFNSSKKVFLLDEVSSYLDEENTARVIATLKKISKSALVLFVTHDVRLLESQEIDGFLSFKGGKVEMKTLKPVSSETEKAPEEKEKKVSGFAFRYLLSELFHKELLPSLPILALLIFSLGLFFYMLSTATADLSADYFAGLDSGETYICQALRPSYLKGKSGVSYTFANCYDCDEGLDKDIAAMKGEEKGYYADGIFLTDLAPNDCILIPYDPNSKIQDGEEMDIFFNGFAYKGVCRIDRSLSGVSYLSPSYLSSLTPLGTYKEAYGGWLSSEKDTSQEENQAECYAAGYSAGVGFSQIKVFSLSYFRKENSLSEISLADGQAIVSFNKARQGLGQRNFFNPSLFSNPGFYRNALNFSAVFPSGIDLKTEEHCSSLLKYDECVITDSDFSLLIKESQNKTLDSCVLVTEANKGEISRILAKHFSSVYGGNERKTIDKTAAIGKMVLYFGGDGQRNSWLFVPFIFFFVLTFIIYFGMFMLSKHRKDLLILRSEGFGEKRSLFLVFALCSLTVLASLPFGMGVSVLLSISMQSQVTLLPKMLFTWTSFIFGTLSVLLALLGLLIIFLKKRLRK